MTQIIETTHLIKTNLVNKKGDAKPDRYIIYQVIDHEGDIGVLTRSGNMISTPQIGQTPRLAIYSGKFHPDRKSAMDAYRKLVANMTSKGAQQGSYFYQPNAEKEWQALSSSVEKRRKAIETRRANKQKRAMVDQDQEDVKTPVKRGKKSQVDEIQVQKTEQVEVHYDDVHDDDPPRTPRQDIKQIVDPPPAPKKGRKMRVPNNFTDGDEAWKSMNNSQRRKWKRENPILDRD